MARGTDAAAGTAARGRAPGARRVPWREAATIRGAELRTAYFFVLPAFALYAIFMLFPFVSSIYLSLTDWDGIDTTPDFIGISNYTTMLQDTELYQALMHNVVWIVIGTIAPIVIGLTLALILWSNTRFALFFRTLFFLPFILPIVVVGLVWQWIYHPLFGVLNTLLEAIGLESLTRGWLGDPSTALLAVLAAAIWGAFGFVTVLLFAGLQNVDMSLVEAASIDGANWFQRARYVVIPQIAPVITLVTAITLIGGFAVIDFIIVMTQGGPGNASEVLGSYAFENGFERNRGGYGAALSMLITVLSLLAAFSFVAFRERGRERG